MSRPAEYRYDVAFSFLKDDEPVARRIDEALAALTLKRFIYSDMQKEIAARDGVDVFSSTFRRESRVAVVLHRKGWGATKWTAIEASAIKARGLEDMNSDSVLFVPLDDSPIPDWVPPQRIYFDLGTGWGRGDTGPIVSSAELAEKTIERLLDAIGKAATRRGR